MIHARARLHPAREELALWIPRDEGRAYVLESGPWSCDEAIVLSTVVRSAPPQELIDAACELREGRMTRIVETTRGFYLAKVRRRTRSWKLPYARVARQIREDLGSERLETACRAESERRRRKARIRLSSQAIAAMVMTDDSTDVAAGASPHPPAPPGFSWDS